MYDFTFGDVGLTRIVEMEMPLLEASAFFPEPRTNLTDARVSALRPGKTQYDIRDKKLRGFGIRVAPSGRKLFFVHCQHRGQSIWKIVGDAGTMDIGGARSPTETTLAAIRRGEAASDHRHGGGHGSRRHYLLLGLFETPDGGYRARTLCAFRHGLPPGREGVQRGGPDEV